MMHSGGQGDAIGEIWQAIMARVKTTDDPGVIRMFSYRVPAEDLAALVSLWGAAMPAPLQAFYRQQIYEHPWEGIAFSDPRHVDLRRLNDQLASAPPLQVPPQVRQPVCFGPALVPFADWSDLYYCLDGNPAQETGGVLHQVLSVSLHTGRVRVVAGSLAAFLTQGLEKLEEQMEAGSRGEAADDLDFGSAVENSLADFRQKIAAGEVSPAFGSFAESVMGMLGDGMQAIQARAEAGNPPRSFEAASALFRPELLRPALEAARAASLQSLPQLPPRITDIPQLKAQAEALLARNPRRHPVQEACARLLESYIAHAENADPCCTERPLIERINDTCEGLAEETIQQHEADFGIIFPDDLHALLQAHAFIAHGGEWLDTLGLAPNVAETCQQINEILAEDAAEEEHWALWPGTRFPVLGRHLIPIGWEEPLLCYDLNPGPGGMVGQLVSVDIEEATCKVEYPGLVALLEESIRQIERA